MLTPGCTSSTEPNSESTEIPDCELDPNLTGCFDSVVLEDDCSPTQVFTGDYCRTMLKPDLLSFGESKVTLVIGTEMQSLTPSFVGDAPSTWEVNPALPSGLSINSDSGVISGTPTSEEPTRSYTIIASNAMGIASDSIEFTILPVSVDSIDPLPGFLHCTVNEACQLQAPSHTGGAPEEWSSDPALPPGLDLGDDGSISGTPTRV